jgi:ketosteroid isomerase-like protein
MRYKPDPMRAHRSLVLLVSALLLGGALAACGGDDKSKAEDTVKDFVKAIDDRDADKFCGDLVTRDFLEKTTGAKGDRAQDDCKRQIKSAPVKNLTIKLIEIRKTTVRGDAATVSATLETQGRRQDQVFRLKKEDGDFKLSGSGR